MDAVARQGLRTLLRSARRDCALLLTTHFMDEADLLADSVAIVAAGRLVCHGPSLSLKARALAEALWHAVLFERRAQCCTRASPSLLGKSHWVTANAELHSGLPGH